MAQGLAIPVVIPAHVLAAPGRAGANDRVQIGVVGVGIRGKYHIGSLPPEGRVVAICDWYQNRMVETRYPVQTTPWREMLSQFAAKDADACTMHQDYRRMLDQKDLDAVMVATPDHHHVQVAMLACQAGHDVYVEKALSLTIAEGRRLVEAVKHYDRVCQVGSQNRSMEVNRHGCQLIRDGGIGKVSRVEVSNYAGPLRYDKLPGERIPEGGNWDLYCGPTPLRPSRLASLAQG